MMRISIVVMINEILSKIYDIVEDTCYNIISSELKLQMKMNELLLIK